MRLPGTRYQEPGWEQVRKLLGQASLRVLQDCDWGQMADPGQAAGLLEWYVDALGAALQRMARSARAEAAGNSYGDSVLELSLSLVYELQAQPDCWQGLVAAIAPIASSARRSGQVGPGPEADGLLRSKINHLFAGLRDLVDAGHYQVSTGRACSPNRIYTYRMLDTAYHQIAALFANWRQHAAQVGAILGRQLDGEPIEVRQMKGCASCKGEWIIRWSATAEQFGAGTGPLHTLSKRFASLKNNPQKIAAMLVEIGDYQELSANRDRDNAWHGDASEATLWLDDYWRVLHQSERDGGLDGDQILAPPEDQFDADGAAVDDPEDNPEADAEPDAEPDQSDATDAGDDAAALREASLAQERASAVSLPPRFTSLAAAAQDQRSWARRVLADESMPIRLAVYHQLLGSADDSYPEQWCDPATGELPTLQQLAALDGISMPTLRKRRNLAIAKLQAANRLPAQPGASSGPTA